MKSIHFILLMLLAFIVGLLFHFQTHTAQSFEAPKTHIYYEPPEADNDDYEGDVDEELESDNVIR